MENATTSTAAVAATAVPADDVDLFNAFATDETAEEEGVKTTIPGFGSRVFTIARENNKTYMKLFNKLYKKFGPILKDTKTKQAEAIADAKAKEIFIECAAKAILLGWEGEILYKGKRYPYSVEAAKMLLQHAEVRKAIAGISADTEKWLIVQEEEEEKN